MEHAVTKPIVRGGVRAFSERRSAMVVMDGIDNPEIIGTREFFSELHSKA